MAAREIRAGRAYVELTLRNKIESGLKNVSRRLRTFGTGLSTVGKSLAAIGTAGTAGLLGLLTIFARTGDALDKMSARTGISVETLSELGFAAEQSGGDITLLEQAVRGMQKKLTQAAKGAGEGAEAFKAMGLQVSAIQKLDPEGQFKAVADGLAGIADPGRRAAVAMQVFEESGQRLLPLFADGARGIEELQQQARDLGLTVSTADASLGAKLTDTLNALYKSVKRVAFVIGAALAPYIIDLAERFTHLVVATRNWIDDNRALIKAVFQIAVGVTAAGAALFTLGAIFTSAGAIIGGLVGVIGAAVATLVAAKAAVLFLVSPIGILIAAVAGISAGLIYLVGVGDKTISFLKQQFTSLRDEVVEAFQGIADAIVSGDLALAAKIAWLTVKLAVQRGMGAILTLYADFKSRLATAGVEVFYGGAQIAAEAYASLATTIANAFAKIRGQYAKLGAFIGEWWGRRTEESIAAQVEQLKAAGRAAAEREAQLKREAALRRGAVEGSQELFDIELAKEQAIARSDTAAGEFGNRERNDPATGIQEQLAADLAQIEADRKTTTEGIQAQLDQRAAALGEALALALQNIKGDVESQTEETAAAIAKAREEWEAAIEQARSQRAARDADRASRPRFTAPDFSLGDAGQRTDSTRGAFDAAAARLLGSDSSVATRTARASETTARQITEATRLLRDIQRQQNTGAVFV